MEAILVVTMPFFALVLLGYLAVQRRLMPAAAIPGLNAYVLYFALPCLLFRFGASMPLRQLLDPVLVGLYALCALVVVALTIALTWRRGDRGGGGRVDLTNAAFGALVAAFPNSGFMGVPLLVALFGPTASGPVIGTLLVDLFLTSTLCLALAQAQSHTGAGPATVALRTLRGTAANPMPWAIALGVAAAALALPVPAALAQIVRLLADSATPVALFTIGAVLRRAGEHAHGHTPLAQVLPVSLIKLLLHPLLVGSLGLAARAAGAPVPASGLVMLVLAAALPSASNVSLLAERYGADNGRVARIVMATTVLAFATFSLLAWRLGAYVTT